MSGTGEKRSLMSRWFGRGEVKSEAPATPIVARAPEADQSDSAAAPVIPENGLVVGPDSSLQGGTALDAPACPMEIEAQDAVVAVQASDGAAGALVESGKKASWFQRLKSGLAKTSARISEGITSVFARRKLDAEALQDLEDILIQADLGVETSMHIVETLAKGRYDKAISEQEVREVLAAEVARVLTPVVAPLEINAGHKPHVILMVGVNGTGKTTTIGKLANRFVREGRSVMLAAGDTFRAAAIDQLKVWGQRMGVPVVARDVGADAAGLAYEALERAREAGCDVLMIDTAGRLQNKQELMAELEKVIRVIKKLEPSAPHDVVLVLDATTGQNALNQVEVFREKAGVTGLIMTKLDGTARGGILVAIAAKYGLPVHAVGVGESAEDLQPFVAEEFARALALN